MHRERTVAAALVATLLTVTLAPAPRALAQQAPAAPAAGGPSLAELRRDEWRKARTPLYMNDFGELNRYRRANAQLGPAAAGDKRVVFFGDSITDMWRLDRYFPGKPYINRGIGGQTTPQMVVRFRQDVIALAPQAVVILAGTNDIAGNSGPMTLEDIQAHYATMAELARLHGIRVIFSSILPVHNYTPRSEITFPLRPPARIAELNRWLRAYCAANGHVYLDYWPATIDEKGWLRRDLAEDGLHPTPAGYALMAPLAQAAIDQVLAQVLAQAQAPGVSVPAAAAAPRGAGAPATPSK